jgi:hypothetical protein
MLREARVPARKTPQSVRILLLVGDRIGANCLAGGKKLSIIDKFRSFGWDVTLAAAARRVEPCPFAAKREMKAPPIDCLVDEILDVRAFTALSVLPGPSHVALIESEQALRLVREAYEAGLVVSAWCHGVRVLAAAGIVRGKRIVGHQDDRDSIEKAGGIFVGHDHPPVTDGHLVTGSRSYYYRAKNADAIRKAVAARAGA